MRELIFFFKLMGRKRRDWAENNPGLQSGTCRSFRFKINDSKRLAMEGLKRGGFLEPSSKDVAG